MAELQRIMQNNDTNIRPDTYLSLITHLCCSADGKCGIVIISLLASPPLVLPLWLTLVHGACSHVGASRASRHVGSCAPSGIPHT